MKRPTIIIVLQCIVLIALIISISMHKIITVFEYFKNSPDLFTSYGLAVIQFLSILFLGFLSYGLWKRKAFSRWISIVFFVIILFAYNVLVILLGNNPINIVKFLLINGISLYFIYELSFGDSPRQFFRLKNYKTAAKKRLKNSIIFDDNE